MAWRVGRCVPRCGRRSEGYGVDALFGGAATSWMGDDEDTGSWGLIGQKQGKSFGSSAK